MIRATFQLVPGLGPGRERALWNAGIKDWADVMQAQDNDLPLRPAVAAALRVALPPLERAWQDNNLKAMALAIPTTLHWRLFGAFHAEAVYLDIETDREDGVTVVGLLNQQGPKLLMAGRDLVQFPQHVPEHCLLVTYNGLSFDVPVLRKAFDDWLAPPAHMDLRHLWNRLGHWGGLKALEDQVGIGRPSHIKDLDGSHASWLWQHARLGDRQALSKLVEYNLYDTVNLRTLAAMGFNRMTALCGFGEQALSVSQRGDVLYDLSQIILAL